jgi:hypothetical protein
LVRTREEGIGMSHDNVMLIIRVIEDESVGHDASEWEIVFVIVAYSSKTLFL